MLKQTYPFLNGSFPNLLFSDTDETDDPDSSQLLSWRRWLAGEIERRLFFGEIFQR